MSEKRRGLGRGLGALIPTSSGSGSRPVDVFFPGQPGRSTVVEDRAEGDAEGEGEGGSPALDSNSTNHSNANSVPASAGSAPDAAVGPDGASADGASTDGTSKHGASTDGTSTHGASTDGTAARGTVTDGTALDETSADARPTAPGDGELRPVPGASYAEIPLDSIRPNPRQPRSVFDEDEMAELVYSIKEIGVLQPIVVRPLAQPEDGIAYELIMGERRWRASREAGAEAVPAIIKATDDDELLRDALLENLHRSQLNPLEEAAAYQQLLEDFQCTQEQLATRIGRSRPQVSNTLRLLKLPPLVARRLAAGVLSAGHARALLGLQDGAAMERLAQRIVAEGLSVRSVEEIVTLGGDEERPAPRKPRPGRRHPQLEDIAAAVSDRLDTRVGITLGQRKGKMTVEFASMEDLNRVLDIMGLRDAVES